MAGKILSLLALPLIVALHLAAGGAILSSTGVVERGVSRLFSEYFHGTLTLESAGLDIFSGFRFEGVSFTPPDRETPLFRARIITVNINGPALFRGTITPQTLKVVDPIIYVEQYADSTFSFESLMDTERLTALLSSKAGRADREPLSLLVVNGLVELAGEGPIAAGLEPYFDQPGSTRIHVPMLHCVDSGQEEMRWWFNCQLNHGALGALQAEGHLDTLGLQDLELELLGVDLSGKRFNSFASEALEEIVDLTGFEGKLTAKLDLERDEEGNLENLLRRSHP